MKIRPVGAKLFYTDGDTDRQADRRTDMTKLTVAFRNYARAPKMLNDGSAKLSTTCNAEDTVRDELIYWSYILLHYFAMETRSIRILEEIKHISSQLLFFLNRAVCEIITKIAPEPGGPYMIE